MNQPRLSAIALGIAALLSSQSGAVHAAPADSAATASAAGAGTVVITGQRASLAKAIAAQDKADNIISVVSSDDIGGLPDKNAAEALARLPGVSVQRDQGEGRYITVRGLGPDLNSVTINGALLPSPEASRRAVALDVLPAGLVRSLEVSKTLTPDQDANALGGAVEVKTLSAFDLPGRLLSVTASASRDQNTRQNSPSGSLLWAQRWLDNTLGVAIGLSAEQRKFGSDNVETGGAWDGDKLGGFELRDYLPQRQRRAFAANLDYRPASGNAWFLRTLLSRFSDDEVRDRLTVNNFAGGGVTEGASATARAERRLRQRKYTQAITSVVAGTEQRWQDWQLHVEGGASRASEDTPEAINDARFRATSNIAGVGFSNSRTPQLTGPTALFDATLYSLNAITLQQRYSEDRERHLRFDLSHQLDAGDWRHSVKFGAKTSRRDKDNDTNQWAYNSSKSSSANYWGAGAVTLASFSDGSAVDYRLGRIGTAISPAMVRARVAGLDRVGARLAAESAINDVRLQEDIDAAYVQDAMALDGWRVLAGVRAERTQFRTNGVQVAGAAITPVQRDKSYTNWLPSLQARYDLDNDTSVRAAVTKAVVRANFSQLSPGTTLTSATEAAMGNPDLKPLRATNLDLGIERLLGTDGTMSAYAFHKDIADFTYATNLAGTGPWVGYTSATSFANGDKATVNGVEFAWSQPLRMLPAPFNGLLVGANAAFTDTKANVARHDSKAGKVLSRSISLPGQSDRVVNLMLGYEAGPLSTRLAVNYKSAYLLELGGDILNAAQDRIVAAQKQLDWSLAWQFSKRWQVQFEAANLNNEKYYVYQGVKNHNAQYEQYGRTYKVTLKASVF